MSTTPPPPDPSQPMPPSQLASPAQAAPPVNAQAAPANQAGQGTPPPMPPVPPIPPSQQPGGQSWQRMRSYGPVLSTVLQIIIIPVVLALLGYNLTAALQATNTQIAQNQQRDNELSAYITTMQGLLPQPGVRDTTQQGADIRSLARAQTLTILLELPTDTVQDPQQIDRERKARVLGFLRDSGLINRDPFPIVSLAGANLSGADLKNAQLGGADLARADLGYADLVNADLSAADLSQAMLHDAKLNSAKLDFTPMRGADLHNANLTNADMSGADLSGATLVNATLTGVDITGTTLPSSGFSGIPQSKAKWKLIQSDTTVKIAYNEGTQLPVYGILDLATSELQLLYGPLSNAGTAVVLMPAIWSQENCASDYCETAPVALTTPLSKIDTSGPQVVIPISGTIAGLQVTLSVTFFAPQPGQDSIKVDVTANAPGAHAIPLDAGQPDAFKAVLLRSMYFIDPNHKLQTQLTAQQAFIYSQYYSLKQPIAYHPVQGKDAQVFGLVGNNTPNSTITSFVPIRNSPTITVTMNDPTSLLVTVEVQASDPNNPGKDNISLWGAFDPAHVQDAWIYSVTVSNPYQPVP